MCLTHFWLTDTIPGRQCMASCFFLLRQFEDVLIYLNSVKVSVALHKARVISYIPVKNHSDITVLWYQYVRGRWRKTPTHWVIGVTSDDKWCFTDAVHLFRCVFSSYQWVSLPIKCQHLVCTYVWILTFLFISVLFFLQGYFYNDDTFNFNYAQAKAALGNYKEAEEVTYFSLHLPNIFFFGFPEGPVSKIK